MNVVELIEGQLKGDTLNKLSSLTGESTSKIHSAIEAAVPSLLAGLSKLASSDSAGTLASALGKVTSETHGNPSEVLAAQPGQVVDKGSNLLGSLLGNNTVGGIVSALSKFTGIGGSGVKNLLGYLTPLALSVIGGEYFKGRTPTAQGLSSMFAEQKDNIAHALPSGLSLDSVPGLGGMASAYRAATTPAMPGTQAALPRWLLPVIGLAILGGLAWYLFSRPAHRPITAPSMPAVPTRMLADPAQLGKDLTSVFSTATASLEGIKDQASAEAALPQLQELNTRLDGIRSAWTTLPESARASVSSIAATDLGKLKETANSVLAIPGVGERIKPTVEAMIDKLSALSG